MVARRDLAIAGIDALDMSAHPTPWLITVHVRLMAIGAEAARKLIDMIEKGSLPAILDLPVERVGRRPKACVPAEPG